VPVHAAGKILKRTKRNAQDRPARHEHKIRKSRTGIKRATRRGGKERYEGDRSWKRGESALGSWTKKAPGVKS